MNEFQVVCCWMNCSKNWEVEFEKWTIKLHMLISKLINDFLKMLQNWSSNCLNSWLKNWRHRSDRKTQVFISFIIDILSYWWAKWQISLSLNLKIRTKKQNKKTFGKECRDSVPTFCTSEYFTIAKGNNGSHTPKPYQNNNKKSNLYVSSVVINYCNNIDSGLHMVDIQIDGCEVVKDFQELLGLWLMKLGEMAVALQQIDIFSFCNRFFFYFLSIYFLVCH